MTSGHLSELLDPLPAVDPVLIDGYRIDRIRQMTLSYAADRYLGELGRDGLAATTLSTYRTYLEKLANMYPHHDVDEVTTDMVRRFLDSICTNKVGEPLSTATQSQRIGIVKKFFAWMRTEELAPLDPVERLKSPKRKNPVDNDNIVSVTTEETQRMLAVAARDLGLKTSPQDRYRALICLGVLSYTGGRRHAVAQLRVSDYDAFAEPHPTLTLHEKGGKTIKKPVAAKLAEILAAADLDGVWTDEDDYLIPGKASQRRPGERDDRIVWKVVKDVARDAKVKSHVHALRAAFAVFFIDNNPEQLLALKELMGHASVATTMIYLRRMNRQRNMAVVVDLDWEPVAS